MCVDVEMRVGGEGKGPHSNFCFSKSCTGFSKKKKIANLGFDKYFFTFLWSQLQYRAKMFQ